MADVIRLADGSVQTVFDLRDMMELIDTHMGDDARRWLEDHLSESDDQEYIADLEDELKRLKDHRREVMTALREASEKIATLIREKEIDRKQLSTTAGRISSITWRELNV